jgi:hypothetical protein
MQPEELELLEQATMAMVVQALKDYQQQAVTIFREETDSPQDIAEDVTREALESMGVSRINERLYGKVDLKKAVYVFLPEAQPVALMLDSKAEKPNGNRTATIQMSQTSMRVRMWRTGQVVDEPGKLDTIIRRGNRDLYVVTLVAKYVYRETETSHELERIIVACIPNGMLQDRYNPDASDGIWLAGRNAPSLGEDFRVRVSYRELQSKASWRVEEIDFSQPSTQ